MAVNPYFSNISYQPEQNLAESLIIETIQIHGMDIKYCPRTLVSPDFIFGEDVRSRFQDAFDVEVYMKNVSGFGGVHDYITKFGLEIDQKIELVMSIKRFQEITGMLRPLDGDLIYVPMIHGLFEITFVEDETEIFFQHGKNYVYNIRCSLFNYSQEHLETGVVNIDGVETRLLNDDSVINDKFADNDKIQIESDSNKPITESNVFGDY